ncbi:MAG: protein kinase [Gammaproteobacteria bacterium]
MRETRLSHSIVLSAIQSKNGELLQGRAGRWLQWLRGQVPGLQSKAAVKQHVQSIIADGVTNYVNHSQDMHLDLLDNTKIKSVVDKLACSDDPAISRFARKSSEKVGEYVGRALNEASRLRSAQMANRMYNLQVRANDAVNQLQHRAFLSGISWETVRPIVQKYLITDLYISDAFGKANPDKVISSVCNALQQRHGGYTLHQEGGRFNAFKSDKDNARLNATQIRTASGNVYALINTPTAEQAKLIKQQHEYMAVQGGKKAELGKGGFGKVRYAQDMKTGEIVAVKKFSSRQNAKNELAELNAVGKGRYFVEGLDYAHVQVNKSGVWAEKSYVFTPLANLGDGTRSMAELESLRKTNPPVARRHFLGIAREYAAAIADMHARGVYHRDIKPANFLHSCSVDHNPVTGQQQKIQRIKIGDYGLASRNENPLRTQDGKWVRCGTPGYLPPENAQHYRSSKHDAFSLGMTLLEMKLGIHPNQKVGEPHIRLGTGQAIQYKFGPDGNCKSAKLFGYIPVDPNTFVDTLPLNCEENIIARLLSLNPEKRLTPQEALNAFLALERRL